MKRISIFARNSERNNQAMINIDLVLIIPILILQSCFNYYIYPFGVQLLLPIVLVSFSWSCWNHKARRLFGNFHQLFYENNWRKMHCLRDWAPLNLSERLKMSTYLKNCDWMDSSIQNVWAVKVISVPYSLIQSSIFRVISKFWLAM